MCTQITCNSVCSSKLSYHRRWYMSKMPVSTTSTANSKIRCPSVLQLFQGGRLWGCVTINIDESEYEKPVANIKKLFGHSCRQHTDEIQDWVIQSLIFAHLEVHKHFTRSQVFFHWPFRAVAATHFHIWPFAAGDDNNAVLLQRLQRQCNCSSG